MFHRENLFSRCIGIHLHAILRFRDYFAPFEITQFKACPLRRRSIRYLRCAGGRYFYCYMSVTARVPERATVSVIACAVLF